MISRLIFEVILRKKLLLNHVEVVLYRYDKECNLDNKINKFVIANPVAFHGVKQSLTLSTRRLLFPVILTASGKASVSGW